MSSNNSDVEKLKECPFCEGKAEIKHIGNEHTKKRKVSICCSTSGCSCCITVGAIQFDMDWCEKKSIEKWNTRTPSESDKVAEALERIDLHMTALKSGRCNPESKEILNAFIKLKSILKGGEV